MLPLSGNNRRNLNDDDERNKAGCECSGFYIIQIGG